MRRTRRLFHLLLVSAVSFLGAAESGAVGVPRMVLDLATGDDGISSSSPSRFFEVSDRAVFATSGAAPEDGVWAFDPATREATYLDDGAFGWNYGYPVSTGSLVFWFHRLEDDRLELRCTDGTIEGTKTVSYYPPQSGGLLAPERLLTAANGIAFFRGWDEEHGYEPWTSDCTPQGTHLLSDLEPGPASSRLSSFEAMEDAACFVATVGAISSVYCSGGTAASTHAIDEAEWLEEFSDRALFSTGTRIVYYAATEDGAQLFGSDGISVGAQRLTDLPSNGGIMAEPAVIGGIIYLIIDDIVHGQELWQSDGTPGGTKRISEFGYARALESVNLSRQVARASGWTYFVATDGLSPAAVWRTSGAPESTALVGGPVPSETWYQTGLFGVGSRLLVTLNRDGIGLEYWYLPSPTGSFELLADICPGSCSSNPSEIRRLGNLHLFEARSSFNRDLYVTDGTPSGTWRATFTPDGSSSAFGNVIPSALILAGELFYRASSSTQGTELFASRLDGSESTLAADLSPSSGGSFPEQITAVSEDRVVFASCRDGGDTLYAAEADPDTILALADLGSCAAGGWYPTIERLGHSVFVVKSNYTPRLWRSDGTPSGTSLLFDPGSGTEIGGMASDGTRLWFTFHDFFEERLEVWSATETSPAATRFAVLPENFLYAGALFPVGHLLFFNTELQDSGGRHVATLDTTTGAVTLLPPTVPYDFGSEAAAPTYVEFDGAVYFFDSAYPPRLIRHDLQTRETLELPLVPDVEYHGLTATPSALLFFEIGDEIRLWRSDGTQEGTSVFHALEGASYIETARPMEAVAVGDWVVFRAWTGGQGDELWATNMTSEGTFLLPSGTPGPESSHPSELVLVGDMVYFVGRDRDHGYELRVIDAATGAISRVSDIAPASLSATPRHLAATDSDLFFQANDLLHSAELWVLPLDESGCTQTSRSLCLNGGRFQVEAFWRDFTGGSGDGVAVPLTTDTGYFWFFDSSNVEVVLKVLDALGVNNRFWVFYGALSNVEYALDVTDTLTRVKRRYSNPPGRYASIGDTDAFAPDGSVGPSLAEDLDCAPTDFKVHRARPRRPTWHRRHANPARYASACSRAASRSKPAGAISRATRELAPQCPSPPTPGTSGSSSTRTSRP